MNLSEKRDADGSFALIRCRSSSVSIDFARFASLFLIILTENWVLLT